MSSDRGLTYVEAANLLGITPGSMRNRARREGWKTEIDERGHTLVFPPTGTAAHISMVDASGVVREDRPSEHAYADQPATTLALDASYRRIAELEAALVSKQQKLDQARTHGQRETERADRLAGDLAGVVQQQADVTILRDMANAERARADALEAQNAVLRAQKDDRISLLERLIAWHRKSWLRKLFEEPPVVWLSGERIPSR